MKKINQFLFAAVAAGTVQIASALNYSPTDVLLVFREQGFPNDVLFDLGSVSNYLGHPLGTPIPVSYDSTLVADNFGGSLSGVDFALEAAVSQQSSVGNVWLTDQNLSSPPPDMGLGSFGQLRSKIESIGTLATILTSSNGTPSFVDPITDRNSYDFVASGGVVVTPTPLTYLSVPTMGGGAPCVVETVNPTTLAFYQVAVNNSTPKPPAALVGAVTLDALGNLYFTAGELPPLPHSTATGITADRIGQTSTVSFSTTAGVNYQLLYSTDLSSGIWTPVSGATTSGDGTIQSLSDFNATDAARFYKIQSNY
jgi:hypothetical protein